MGVSLRQTKNGRNNKVTVRWGSTVLNPSKYVDYLVLRTALGLVRIRKTSGTVFFQYGPPA